MRTLIALAMAMAVSAGALAQTGTVEVKNAWARATPGGAENGAAYLTIESPTADRLTGVASPAAAKVELHRMTMEGGIMRMAPLPAIDLPPGEMVTLKPGGMHIMLKGLKHPLHPGDAVPLTLTFDKAGTREVTAMVGKAGASGPDSHAGHAMPMPAHR